MPREKHIPDDAQRTSVCLTDEDRFAITWISTARRQRKNRRWSMNDILVDALWYLAENEEGINREKIQAMIPVAPKETRLQTKVTQMPKPRSNKI